MSKPRKIAILGGGMGSLSAAYYITNQPDWSKDYEVTVYQMGWRLGGKGASGRNRDQAERIEEHGVHIFLGMYHNAFRLMKDCYDQLDRQAGEPLSRCFSEAGHDAAFEPHSALTFWEEPAGTWIPWSLDFATDDRLPGRPGRKQPSVWGLFRGLLRLLQIRFHSQRIHFRRSEAYKFPASAAQRLTHLLETSVQLDFQELSTIDMAEIVAEQLTARPDLGDATLSAALDDLALILEQFLHELEPATASPRDSVRRLRILLRTGAIITMGMLRDGVIMRGFDHLDQYEFKAWLERHGAEQAESWSAPVQSLYELVLGFDPMDRHRPDMGAGTTLRGALRLFLDYEGAIAWKMQAGMGDAVFAPLYLLLKQRGVNFNFFHRVTGLELSNDGKSIQTVRMVRQAELQNQNGQNVDPGSYYPLIEVPYGANGGKLCCWPTEPVYNNPERDVHIEFNQVEELKKLKAVKNLDLESAWINWRRHEVAADLQAGTDFDEVILGIAVGALSGISRPLMAASLKWKAMVENLATVPSQSAQLWMNRSATDLNCGQEIAEPMYGSYKLNQPRPWPNWVGMSQLIEGEAWPVEADLRHIAYLYTQINEPLREDEIPEPYAEAPDEDFPERVRQTVKQELLEFLSQEAGEMWPCAMQNSTGELEWDLLIDPEHRPDAGRLDAQYWRININPSDRYVSHTTDTLRYRIHSEESGFRNLYLAGDWTLTGLNSGCAEAATMSGMQAARAVCGQPLFVYWEKDKVGIF